MAQLLDARDPGLRLVHVFGFAALSVALVLGGARLAAAGDVEVNLDVLKTVPAGKSGASGKAIKLIPPKAKHRTVGRREEALRRARKRRLIEQAKRKAAAKKKAEAARKEAAKKKAEEAHGAEEAHKAEEARKAEEAKQAAEMERKAKAAREAEAAQKVTAAREAEAASKAEAVRKAAETKAAEKKAAIEKAAKPRAAKAASKPATKPKTASATAKKQIATRHPQRTLVRERLLFGKESAKLSPAAKGKLGPIAEKMVKQSEARLVIYAYAAGDGSNPSDVRRLSLSRALAVRRLIMGRGIPATRTEIRALGARAGGGPLDRVDLVLVPR
jgi:outer membrane protein OmpA-like peptidoglycan-associated protein